MLRVGTFLNPLLWALVLSVCLHVSLLSVDFAIPQRSSSGDVPISPIAVNLVSDKPLATAQPRIHPIEEPAYSEPAQQPSEFKGLRQPIRPSDFSPPASLPWKNPISPQKLVAVLSQNELAMFQAPKAMPLLLSSAKLAANPAEKGMLESKVEAWQQALSNPETKIEERWEEGGLVYQARMKKSAPEDVTGLGSATVEVTRTVNGVTQQTALHFRQVAFSYYTQFVDNWLPDILMSKERIEGRFHSNSRVRISVPRKKETRVSGQVTIASYVAYEGWGDRTGLFPKGLKTGAKPIPMPKNPFVSVADALDDEHVHYVEEDTQLIFNQEGSYTWNTLAQPEVHHQTALPETPWVIVAGEGVRLRVEGTVRGVVAVYSPRLITITGNVYYARDPREQADSPDYLALISDKVVELAGPSVTGRGDLSVFASIYAGREFAIHASHLRGYALLTLYGNVTAGSLPATEPRFVTHSYYDPRLERRRAPHFPLTQQYVFEEWEPIWEPVETSTLTQFN